MIIITRQFLLISHAHIHTIIKTVIHIFIQISSLPEKKSIKGKVKVLYGQEPPSGGSTTTECGVN